MSDGWVGGRTYDSEAYSAKALAEQPLPDGVYWALVTKADAGQTKEGKPAVNLELKVTSKHGGDDGEFNRRVFDGIYFIGKDENAERSLRRKQKSVADTMGIDTPRGDTFEALEVYAKDILSQGKSGFYVILKTEADMKGVDRNRIAAYLPSEQVDAAVKRFSNGSSNGFARR